MRDDVQHSLAELGHAAEGAAAPIGFDGIRRRARRRRRAQTLSAVVLCVVAAGAGLGIDQAAGSHRSVGPVHHGSPHPSPTTAPSPSVPTPSPAPGLAARQIVQNPRSFVVASTVFPGDANQAATLWELGPAGPKAKVALTITVDGYTHARYVPLPTPDDRDCNDIRAVGNQRFLLSCANHELMVGSDGSVTVPRHGSPSSQVRGDAVLVSQSAFAGKGTAWSWIDSQGVMHGLDVPVTGPTWLVQAPDGRIWGLDYGLRDGSQSLIWSTDGGRTWSQRALPGPPSSHTNNAYEIVATAVHGRMVLARGSAETVFSPKSILVFGSTGRPIEQDTLALGHAAMDSAVVTPDGSLVMDLYNEPEGGTSGLYRAGPGTWSNPQKVLDPPTRPSGQTAGALWMGTSRDAAGHPVVWAVFDTGVLASSTDDGQTWTTRSIR